MRACFRILLLAGFAAMPALAATPAVLAADLTVTRGKRAVGVVHHRARVVADYDGTPIVLRRVRPMVTRGPDGAVVVERGLYQATAVQGPTPLTYLNGQRVR